jgi:hypothetical protein
MNLVGPVFTIVLFNEQAKIEKFITNTSLQNKHWFQRRDISSTKCILPPQILVIITIMVHP